MTTTNTATIIAKVELYNLFKPGHRNPTNGWYVGGYEVMANGSHRRVATLANFRDDEDAARAFAASKNLAG